MDRFNSSFQSSKRQTILLKYNVGIAGNTTAFLSSDEDTVDIKQNILKPLNQSIRSISVILISLSPPTFISKKKLIHHILKTT